MELQHVLLPTRAVFPQKVGPEGSLLIGKIDPAVLSKLRFGASVVGPQTATAGVAGLTAAAKLALHTTYVRPPALGLLKAQLNPDATAKGLELTGQILTVLNSVPGLTGSSLISVPSVIVSGIELGKDIANIWSKREYKRIPLILLKAADVANSAAELTGNSLLPPVIALTIKGANFGVGIVVSARDKSELSATANMLETMATSATLNEFKEKWDKIVAGAA